MKKIIKGIFFNNIGLTCNPSTLLRMVSLSNHFAELNPDVQSNTYFRQKQTPRNDIARFPPRASAINKKAVLPAPPARPLSKPVGANAAAFYLLLSVSSSESVLSKASVPGISGVGFFFLSVALTARM